MSKTPSVSIRADESATAKNKRGPAKGQGGRPKGAVGPAKVRMNLLVLPETKDAIERLGSPSAVLDRLFAVMDAAELAAVEAMLARSGPAAISG